MKTLVLLALLAPSIAAADPDPTETAAPVDQPEPAPVAKPQKIQRFYVRLGVARVQPLSQSSELELADVNGPASLSLKNGPIAGSGSTIDAATFPAAIIGYVLPWMNNRLSIETILGPPLEVKFQATGTLRDMSIAPTALGIPTGVPALGPDLGEAKAVPPVVTLVYALRDHGVVPYVGAGASVLFAYGAHATNPLLTEVSQPKMSIAPAPGLALQAGIDAHITNRIYARLDVKFIALMYARATVEHIVVRTPDIPLFDTVEVGTAHLNMWVNPLILQAAVGADF